mgnify:CR=1 FL=1|tara:strand:- start:35 stop:3865 length:3831 start_codon:yes stop_codon:yes gene_type:complete
MKVRLKAYRRTLLETGVFASGNYSESADEVVVTVTGVDATTIFIVGQYLWTGAGGFSTSNSYGRIKSIDSSTQITFWSTNIDIDSGEQFFIKAEGTFELDLLKEPNISLNYQFDDVKEPDKRKGSFSQTFKLPFTNNNNKFFQDWYNVNLDTLGFDIKGEYDATIFVGTVPQFEGVLQLRSVYKKAKYYDVVVFSKISTLFSLIGDSSLRDAFLSNDGNSWNDSLNHVFNHTQMKDSWDGSSSDFENASTPAVSLKDPDYNVQKVMYPFSVTKQDFYYNPGNNVNNNYYLAKSIIDANEPGEYITDITQFRPAIQIKEMIKIILGKLGLSYTSDFIDSEYFSKIFMTTGGHLEDAPVPIVSESTVVVAPGQVIVGYAEASSWGNLGTPDVPLTSQQSAEWGNNCEDDNQVQYSVNPDTIIENSDQCYYPNNNYFKKKHPTQNTLIFKSKCAQNISTCPNCSWPEECNAFTMKVELVRVKINGAIYTNPLTGLETIYATSYQEITSSGGSYYTHNIDISELGVGTRFTIRATALNWKRLASNEVVVAMGLDCSGGCGDWDNNTTCVGGWDYNEDTQPIDCLSTIIEMNYDGYDLAGYGAVRDVPACIDPELKQKDFFKDLIQRFNLIVTTNPNNPSNIIIEPYDTYLGSGTLRYWTDKLDLSKEIIVKDTSSLQKERIYFTDKEDVDLYNKEVKERHEWANVYGHLEITETNNKWAKGELTNNPFFSPYINGKVIKNWGLQGNYQTLDVYETLLHNVAVQYEFSYKADDDGDIDIESAHTQPKLFWYNGAPTDIRNNEGEAKTIYMHAFDNTGWSAFSFTQYPLCSPYELTPDATLDTAYIGPTTKSLYWDSWATPFVPELTVFNWTEATPTNWNYCLYGYYWKDYLSSLHDPDSRLMDCYLNLNEVDIFNFDFNDEIFIKDSYWRILKIHNYQVGVKASTKVTFIKIVNSLKGRDCDKSISSAGLYDNLYLQWCPNTDTDCTPAITYPDVTGLFVSKSCCESRGGTPDLSMTYIAEIAGFTNGELPCKAYQGSTPISKRILSTKNSIRSLSGLKSMGQLALTSNVNNFSIGSGKQKTNRAIMTPIKDDLSIKYQTEKGDIVTMMGESHRMVLTGQTNGTTTGYAYPRGSDQNPSLSLPDSSNVMIRVNSICTVIAGKNTSYPVGYTEATSYYTAFKMQNGTGVQIGTAGGVQEFLIAETTARTSLSITLSTATGELNRVLFGLVDSIADVQRAWALTVDFHIQKIPSLETPLDTDWALYQNSETIQLQNGKSLLWN